MFVHTPYILYTAIKLNNSIEIKLMRIDEHTYTYIAALSDRIKCECYECIL